LPILYKKYPQDFVNLHRTPTLRMRLPHVSRFYNTLEILVLQKLKTKLEYEMWIFSCFVFVKSPLEVYLGLGLEPII